MIVEKRIAGIIHWLERLKQSYSSGAIENALMDAECARADLEDLRLAVWSKVRPKARSSNSGWLRSAAYALPLSVMIVMLMVMPLSREIVPQEPEAETEKIVLAEPIIVVREEEPEPVIRRASSSPAPAKKQTPPKRTAVTRSAPAPKQQPTKQVRASVAYDKVPYLLQTGQRALKNSSSVIKLGR